jgi:hypothetical protein
MHSHFALRSTHAPIRITTLNFANLKHGHIVQKVCLPHFVIPTDEVFLISESYWTYGGKKQGKSSTD